MLGTRVLEFQSLIASIWYSSYLLWSESLRAEIEPLIGLKASCPSLEAQTLSQAMALSRWGAFLGSPKESDNRMKVPAVPGAVVHLYFVKFLTLSRPWVQSPMTIMAGALSAIK